ncbi:adhesion G-protein coupled receptor G2-like isoform X1 [Apostichopus japonicus]|uniref:adhesion G-protein coupled receptor G2-like isoform X1 n=1 Tax=Stichopus japonicus TaxID=307972 RepID=UPI003AB87FE2
MKQGRMILWRLVLAAVTVTLCYGQVNKTVRVCEHKILTVTCDAGEVIHIHDALYGRMSDTNCTSRNPPAGGCKAEHSLSNVTEMCENLTSCSVHASNDVFGDPCRGYVKYLEVTYSCVRICGLNDKCNKTTEVCMSDGGVDVLCDCGEDYEKVEGVCKATGLENELMDIINSSESIAEISDDEDFLEEDPQRIELLISSLESVVRAGEASINVTDPVVRSINNLMNLDRDVLEDGMIEGGRAVAALEGQITNFQTNDGNFSTVLDNVGVTAVKIDARSVGSSLAYANILPENETLLVDGSLQEGNTRLFSDGDAIPLERTATSISVPTTVLDLLGRAGVELTAVPVTFIIYGNDVLFRPSMPTEAEENIEEEDKSTVNERVASQIISAIIRTENTSIVKLPQDSHVIATFLSNLKISVEETIEAQDCVVWSYNENTGEGFWTKDGCKRMFHDNRDLTMCSCDRLGSFAILIRVRKGPVEDQVALYYVTLIGSIISGLALVGCLIVFVSLKSFRSKQPTHIHINLCLSLLGFYIAFLLSPLAVGKDIYCTLASVIIHFFCLSTLAWMSAEAVNMYYLFLKTERTTVRHFTPIACLLAYGLPAACALLVVFLDNSTDFQSASYCFIHPGYALYFGFLTEVGAMFVFNSIIFIWVIRKILCRPLMVSQTAKNAKRNEIIKRVRHAILFWFVFGLSWIFGFSAAVDTKTLIFDYLYCFFISMQGILMFLLLCVANPAFQVKFKRTGSTQTKVTRQATARSLPSSQHRSSSRSNIPMDSMDNPSTSATK